jgi:hypothetical protein
MDIRLLGYLGNRLSKLPKSIQKIVLEDLETAAINRLAVMERTKHAN